MEGKVYFLLMRGFALFIREFRLNIFSLITLCTLIFVYYVIYTVGFGVSGFLSDIAKVSNIRVYISSDIQAPEKVSIPLSSIEGVSSVKYYSSSDAKNFVVSSAPNVSGIKNFSDEFFPSFIEVIPKESSKKMLDKISYAASEIKGVESVSYGKEYMSRFMMISGGFFVFIVIISALFASAAAFTTYNTVKVSLYKFREEIRLYSLVGGTRPFISVPYVFSSLLQCFFSYIIAVVIFIFAFNIFNNGILIPADIKIFHLPGLLFFIISLFLICVISAFSAGASVISFLKRVSFTNDD